MRVAALTDPNTDHQSSLAFEAALARRREGGGKPGPTELPMEAAAADAAAAAALEVCAGTL